MFFKRKKEFDIDKLRDFLFRDKGRTVKDYLKKYNIKELMNYPFLGMIIDLLIIHVEDNYMEELMNDEEILDLFIKAGRCDFTTFSKFSYDTCEKVLKRLLELNVGKDEIVDLYRNFSYDNQEKLLFLIKDRVDILMCLIERDNFRLISKILNNDMIDLVSENIDLEELFATGREDTIELIKKKYETGSSDKVYDLSSELLTDELLEKIWNNYNIFRIREIITDSVYVTNSTIINDYIKKREEREIINSLKTPLIPLYKSLYDKFLIQLEINGLSNSKDYKDYFNEFYRMSSRLRNVLTPLEEELSKELEGVVDSEELYERVKELNYEAISNYIVDYHFEENYYNIELDIRELMDFYDRGNIELDSKHIELYRSLLEIDSLLLEDKVKLHYELKKYNMMEMLYDDMLKARRIVNNDIKNRALNSENIKKYKDEALSNYYGVDIYVIEDTELCAIVKSDDKYKNEIPTGYSYSLAGYNMTGTYKPNQDENYVYDAGYLKTDQIMHVYPEDSYTTPAVFGCDEPASIRVNRLLISSELLKEDSDYSEILVLEKGSIPTPIDDDIPALPILALYCQDNYITPSMVELAKKDGVGIVYVKKTLDDRIRTGSRTKADNVEKVYYTEMFSYAYNEERRKMRK